MNWNTKNVVNRLIFALCLPHRFSNFDDFRKDQNAKNAGTRPSKQDNAVSRSSKLRTKHVGQKGRDIAESSSITTVKPLQISFLVRKKLTKNEIKNKG